MQYNASDKDCEGIGGALGYLGIGWLGETRLSNL